MDGFRFTLFNDVTLFVMALTIAVIVWRFRSRVDTNAPLVYYAVVLAYTFAFHYSLSPYWVFAGLLCTLLMRFKKWEHARWVEVAVFVYIFWRLLALVMMW